MKSATTMITAATFFAITTTAALAQAGPPQGSVQPSPGGPEATKQDLSKPGPASGPSVVPPGETSGAGMGTDPSDKHPSGGVKSDVSPGAQMPGADPNGEPVRQPRQ